MRRLTLYSRTSVSKTLAPSAACFLPLLLLWSRVSGACVRCSADDISGGGPAGEDAGGVPARPSWVDQQSDGASCLLLRAAGQGTLQWKLPRGARGLSAHPSPACLSVPLACRRQDLGVCFKDSGLRSQESRGWSFAGNEARGCQPRAARSSAPSATAS